MAIALWFDIEPLLRGLGWLTLLTGILLAVYTAFLFGQAKGRDFWQSPGLALHMLGHSVMAGGAIFALLSVVTSTTPEWTQFL